jgi:hypothetical protein
MNIKKVTMTIQLACFVFIFIGAVMTYIKFPELLMTPGWIFVAIILGISANLSIVANDFTQSMRDKSYDIMAKCFKDMVDVLESVSKSDKK